MPEKLYRYAQATSTFIYLVDTFFDCLNATSKLIGQMKRIDALKPYHDENDWRFQVRVSITIYCLIWNAFTTLQKLYYTLAPPPPPKKWPFCKSFIISY